NEDGDDQCLLRFAQEAMPEFRAALPVLMPQLPQIVRDRARTLVDWLRGNRDPIPDPPVRAPARPNEEIQSGILSGYPDVTHGGLFLLAITAADKARAFLAQLEAQLSTEAAPAQPAPLPEGVHHCNVAFTAQGLAKLGVEELDRFPQEFL